MKRARPTGKSIWLFTKKSDPATFSKSVEVSPPAHGRGRTTATLNLSQAYTVPSSKRQRRCNPGQFVAITEGLRSLVSTEAHHVPADDLPPLGYVSKGRRRAQGNVGDGCHQPTQPDPIEKPRQLTDEELKAQFLATKGTTSCPPAPAHTMGKTSPGWSQRKELKKSVQAEIKSKVVFDADLDPETIARLNARQDRILETTPCPDCRAKKGEYCRRANGRSRLNFHKARSSAFRLLRSAFSPTVNRPTRKSERQRISTIDRIATPISDRQFPTEPRQRQRRRKNRPRSVSVSSQG